MTEPTPMSSLDDLQPRFPGMSREALARVLYDLDEALGRDPGSFEYRYVETYAHRANVRFALGLPANLVMDDFMMAGRCLSGDPGVHLGRHTEEQLLTRRVRPVEYGVLSGNLSLAERLAINYAVPAAQGRAGLGAPALTRELRILSPALVNEPILEPAHLMGLAASIYSAALAAAVQGYEEEVRFLLRWLAQAESPTALSDAERAVMVRYAGLSQALGEVVLPAGQPLEAMLADQIQRSTSRLKVVLGLEFQQPTHPHPYVDTSVLAIMALAIYTGRTLEGFPPDPDITPYARGYADLIEFMLHRPPEEPLSAEDVLAGRG